MTEKVRGRPFQKGDSGNPAGRPRSGESIAEYIRQLAGADGRVYIDKLHALATGEDTDARVLLAAIGVLLERGFGKAPQAIEHSGTIDSPKIDTDVFTDQELHLLILLTRRGLRQSVPELTAVRDLLEEAVRRMGRPASE